MDRGSLDHRGEILSLRRAVMCDSSFVHGRLDVRKRVRNWMSSDASTIDQKHQCQRYIIDDRMQSHQCDAMSYAVVILGGGGVGATSYHSPNRSCR